jgi:hypothetical protein
MDPELNSWIWQSIGAGLGAVLFIAVCMVT